MYYNIKHMHISVTDIEYFKTNIYRHNLYRNLNSHQLTYSLIP